MSKRIAIFGGTFDPPHNGHIHLVISLRERHRIDEVWVIPAWQNPLKEARHSASDRLMMCRLAFEPIPGCRVLDVEARRPAASFTIETIDTLLEESEVFRAAERFLFLGADAAARFLEWKDVHRLLTLVTPLVAARQSFSPVPSLRAGWTDTGLFDVSSTQVRSRLHGGLYVAHLIPHAVLEYIQDNQLYGDNE